ncbi:MAG: RNA polymerase sigma factor [Chloroflexota bacterium]
MIDALANDRHLIDAVLAGDREAFRVFVERESVSVITACSRILRDPTEAQDAAQDTFVQAFEALGSYRGDGPFGAWLRRIAVRVAIAKLAARRDVVVLDELFVDGHGARADEGSDPEALALGVEDRTAIVEAIGTLPADQRDVVLLRFYGDLSLEEISRVTSRPLGTVKSRLARGTARLRDRLEARSVS